MTLDFQLELLRYVARTKEGFKMVNLLDQEAFDLGTHKLILDLLHQFAKEYRLNPTKAALLEFFDHSAKSSKTPLKEEVYKTVEAAIRELYTELVTVPDFNKKKIIEYAMQQRTRQLFKNRSGAIGTADEHFFRSVFREMSDIIDLTKFGNDEYENRDGGYLLADHNKKMYEDVPGIPTYIQAMNRMMASGGFKAPELIIILGGPKAFKTGLMLNLAVDFVLAGKRVYYADAENSVRALRTRANQCMLKCTRGELKQPDMQDALDEIVTRYKAMGGDMKLDYFPANTCSAKDVDARLQKLRDEDNWEPEIIFLDYIDLFIPEDSTIKEKRFKIQAVYHDFIRLNNRWNCPTVSVSPVNRKAVSKEVFEPEDVGEDFAKIYNCHACFAWCRTDEEMRKGLGRIIAVVQREGESYVASKKFVTMKVDEPRMSAAPIDIVRREEMMSPANRVKMAAE